MSRSPTSEEANRPHWQGQAGFFEIWFLVVFDPSGERAWWLRYTLFSPKPGAPGERRATLWAAAFDRAAETVALKSIHPISAFDAGSPGSFGIHIGDAGLSPGKCVGSVASGGQTISWDLRYSPAIGEVARREPRGAHRLPLTTHVAHSHGDVTFSGSVSVNGHSYEVKGAPGLQKHIWGTRRVEELFWISCPRFEEDPGAHLEVLSVRPRRAPGVPRFSPIYLRAAGREHTFHELPKVLLTRVEVPRPGEILFRATGATTSLRGRASCDPRTLAGYAYRDPEGWDVKVAQSDIAACEIEIASRRHPLAPWEPARRLRSACAAIEFHGPDPLAGVRYIDWDATALPGAERA